MLRWVADNNLGGKSIKKLEVRRRSRDDQALAKPLRVVIMKAFSWTCLALAALGNNAAARELIPDENTRALYDSGTVHMELKSLKLVG